MRKLTRSTLAATAVVGLLALPVAGAGAATSTQEVTGTVGTTVTIDATPATAALGTLPATNFNAGSITVSANEGYLLTVQSDKATMTEWSGTTPAYGTNALASPMTMASTASSGNGTALGTATAITNTAPVTIGSNVLASLLTSTDTYALAVNQPATALDAAGNYRLVLTYTASLNP